MPPCLLSNLLKALSNLSPNIQKIGNSPYWLPGQHRACLKIAFVHVRDVTVSQFQLSHAHEG